MSEIEDKLKRLLNYWVEHNREHAGEFREWAEKVKNLEAADTWADLLQAAQEMEKVNEFLNQALLKLEKGE